MSLTCQQKEQLAVRSGESFFWAASNQALADGESIFVFAEAINDLEAYLRSVIIDSDGTEFLWQMYVGSEITPASGQDVPLHSRNEGVKPKFPVKITMDPTVTVQGDSLFPDPRVVLAQTAPGNNSYLYQEVLTGGYIVPDGIGILFEFKNNSGAIARTQILMSGRENI